MDTSFAGLSHVGTSAAATACDLCSFLDDVAAVSALLISRLGSHSCEKELVAAVSCEEYDTAVELVTDLVCRVSQCCRISCIAGSNDCLDAADVLCAGYCAVIRSTRADTIPFRKTAMPRGHADGRRGVLLSGGMVPGKHQSDLEAIE